MLFQSGVQFWFSDRARTVLESAEVVAANLCSRASGADHARNPADARRRGRQYQPLRSADSAIFAKACSIRWSNRDLTEAAIFRVDPRQAFTDDRDGKSRRAARSTRRFPRAALPRLQNGQPRDHRSQPIASRLDQAGPEPGLYLYISRVHGRRGHPAMARGAKCRRRLSDDAQPVAGSPAQVQCPAAARLPVHRRGGDLDRA